VYQWKVNNINAGNNSPNFTSAAFLNGDQVTCELSSNSTCASNTLGLSNAITMSVSSVLVPSVSVSIAQGSNPTCAGSPLSFSASVVNGGLAPAYQWQVNGASVGNNSPLYSTILNNSSTITCLMISSSSCANPQSVLSSALAFTVNPIPPIPGITASGSLSFCEGDSVILFSSSPTGNIWSNGANTSSILVNTSGTYTVTQTTNSCMSLPSLPVSVSVHPLPVCSIPVGPFCVEDAPVVLQGLPAGGAFSGTGVNGNVFTPSLSPPGNVSLLYQYTDANNCQDTSLFTVMVSECLGLSGEKSQRESVLVYPNPASGLLHVHSALSEIKIIRIINLNGKEVLHEFLTENSTQYILNLSSLANGIYSMKVDFGEQTNTYKLCVMK
jgi:Secretion system C-terminal sorting domain